MYLLISMVLYIFTKYSNIPGELNSNYSITHVTGIYSYQYVCNMCMFIFVSRILLFSLYGFLNLHASSVYTMSRRTYLVYLSVKPLLNAQDSVHWLLSKLVQQCIGCLSIVKLCIQELPPLLRK